MKSILFLMTILMCPLMAFAENDSNNDINRYQISSSSGGANSSEGSILWVVDSVSGKVAMCKTSGYGFSCYKFKDI